MDYAVQLKSVAASPIAVVATRTTFDQFPELLQRVHTALASQSVDDYGRSLLLIRDVQQLYEENGHLAPHDVEVGVELGGRFESTGEVTVSSLPAGTVVTATHRGGFEGLPNAHQAIAVWCAENGHSLAGPMWELYGNSEDSGEDTTEIYYLLEAATPRT
jgi:effector-binding domain-containing protein